MGFFAHFLFLLSYMVFGFSFTCLHFCQVHGDAYSDIALNQGKGNGSWKHLIKRINAALNQGKPNLIMNMSADSLKCAA